MRILFILEYYYPNIGGVEKLFKHLAEELVKYGNEVTVITSRFDKKLPKEEVLNGVKIKRLKLSNRFLFTFFSVFSLFKHLKGKDFVHTTSYNAALPAWIVAKILRKKNIITFHEVWGKLWFELPYLNQVQRLMYSSFEKFILKLNFDYYIAVSGFTREKLIEAGIKQERIFKIYNGINQDEYEIQTSSLPENFTFTYFGRLGVSKGLNLILPAAKRIIDRHPESMFKFIIPTIPKKFYRKILKELSKLEIDSNLILLHDLSFEDLKREISKSHCVLIPSYSEGFCFAAVESGALSIPVISSGLGALKETVTGKHIILNEQTVEELSVALESAYNGKFNESKAKEFSLDESINQYLELYNDIISKQKT